MPPISNSIKMFVSTRLSKWRAQKIQTLRASPLVLAFKKGLQNQIKCPIFVGNTQYVNLQNIANPLKQIHFIDEIKLIL